MITRDFLLRQIEQMVQVLARVLFLKSNERREEALTEIDRALNELPGLESLLTMRLSRERVLDLATGPQGFQPQKAIGLADLLRERALLLREEDEEEARQFFRYALWLYVSGVESRGAVLPLDVHDRIAFLRREAGGWNAGNDEPS